jgi:anti-sigma regulatory factor (Ser/Thr protein kinase)
MSENKSLNPSLVQYVEEEVIIITIPSDPTLISVISYYISSLVENANGGARDCSLELVMDEALTNAISHGNLEVSSVLKEDDFGVFYETARRRRGEQPYASRKVFITILYRRNSLVVKVRDEGPGFDWRNYNEAEDVDKPCGRGLKIMRAYSSRMEFNSLGNEITLNFNGYQLRAAMGSG